MSTILPASYFSGMETSRNLQQYLMNHPLVVVGVGFALCFPAAFLPKPGKIILLIVYLGFIVYMTILLRETGESHANLEVFWSYRQFFSNPYYGSEILQNIWLFVPLGALMYGISRHRILILVPVLVSVLIELTQLIFGYGLFEFDDIISNSLGGFIGFFIAYTITALARDLRTGRSTVSD